MKTTLLTKSLAAAIVLGGFATLGMAKDTGTWTCPLGNEPGYGRAVNLKQKKNARRNTSRPRFFGYCQRQGKGRGQGWQDGYCPRDGRGWRNGYCRRQNRR